MVSGTEPVVDPVALNAATGTNAPVPVRALVLAPSLAEAKVTVLLNDDGLSGAKFMSRFVEPNPGMLNTELEMIVKGPPFSVAVPFVSVAPPRFVRMKLATAFEPTATVPKFRADGNTDSCAGVRPMPVTVFVLLPPLLEKTTALLKLAPAAGVNATLTTPVAPGASV